jgi:hypothetical protein
MQQLWTALIAGFTAGISFGMGSFFVNRYMPPVMKHFEKTVVTPMMNGNESKGLDNDSKDKNVET